MNKKSQLTFHFLDDQDPVLNKVIFTHPLLEAELLSVRGRTGGIYDTQRTFQWTSAVQALSILIVRTVIFNFQKEHTDLDSSAIKGGHGSLAASLDYALDKQPAWLLDMFGIGLNGTPLTKRIFRRSNPGRRVKGPVSIAINTSFLDPADILLICDDIKMSSLQSLKKFLARLEIKAGVEDPVANETLPEPDLIEPDLLKPPNDSVHHSRVTFKTPFVLHHTSRHPVYVRLYEDAGAIAYVATFVNPDEVAAYDKITVRIQFSCPAGEILNITDCDCGDQLEEALQSLENVHGVLIYLLDGHRNSQLFAKYFELSGIERSRKSAADEYEAGFNDRQKELKLLRLVPIVFQDLGIKDAILLSNNPKKVQAINQFGTEHKARQIPVKLTPQNMSHLYEKMAYGGHTIGHVFLKQGDDFYCETPIRLNTQSRTWIIAGDDTLWEDNIYYEEIVRQFLDVVVPPDASITREEVRSLFEQISRRNILEKGFGSQIFESSLRRTLRVLEERHKVVVQPSEQLLNTVAERLLHTPIRTHPDAEDLLLNIKSAGEHSILFSQGPIEEQLRKISQLHITPLFDAVAITKRKNIEQFKSLISRLKIPENKVVVIGNNLETEIAPAVELGLTAIFYNNPNSWSVLNRMNIETKNYREARRLRDAWIILNPDSNKVAASL